MATRRKVTNEGIRKAFHSIGTKHPDKVFTANDVIRFVAKRVSRSFVATARRLHKLGLINTKTARSR
jgi:hypothetical protein